MVPVPDVLRHIATQLRHVWSGDEHLIRFLADMQEGRLRLFHPSAQFITTVANLPSVCADVLYVASYNPATKSYHGRFHWFSSTPHTYGDCQQVQLRLNELMQRTGWEDFQGSLEDLPLPPSRLVGGLLACRNGDGWITLAIVPDAFPVTVSLLHLVQALPVSLLDLQLHPEDINMGQVSPMIDRARRAIPSDTDPRRHLLLSVFFDKLQRRRLQLVGAMPGEEEAFFHPGNDLEVVFCLATKVYREGQQGEPDFWTERQEFRPHDESLSHVVEERLHRFLARRRSIFPDDVFPQFNARMAIPDSSVNAGWVITCHPFDGLQTRLFVVRGHDPKVGVCCLEEATRDSYLRRQS